MKIGVRFLSLSIRIKLLLTFLLFTLFGIFLVFSSLYYQKLQGIEQRKLMEVSRLHVVVLNHLYHQERFFNTEEYAEQLHRDKTSESLDLLLLSAEKIREDLLQLSRLEEENQNGRDVYNEMLRAWNELQSVFQSCVSVLLKRGFKDYGMEGKMRVTIHALMEDPVLKEFSVELLSIRRHEKDYIIRGTENYAELLRLEVSRLEGKMTKRQLLSGENLNKQRLLLNTYLEQFNEFLRLNKLFGMRSSKGLKLELYNQSRKMQHKIESLKSEVQHSTALQLNKLNSVYRYAMVLLLLIPLLLSFYFSSLLSSRIRNLSSRIQAFVKSSFMERQKNVQGKMRDEIYYLQENLTVLEDEIAIRFREFRERSERTTREILEQKERIEYQKSRIEEQRDVLFHQKEIVETQNKNIIDSMVYAKRIQDYMFPKEKKLQQYLFEYFVFFRPKDIVSGDFYWMEVKNNWVWIAVGDCTGHGVPGAFMSIIGTSLLNEAILEKQIDEPFEVLNFMNKGIARRLGQNGHLSEIKDGMDIALVKFRIDDSSGGGELFFSGAQRNLVMVRRGNLQVIKGNRRPIGWIIDHEIQRFSQIRLSIDEGDQFYLFTDGYADQFGGEHNSKFKQHKLLELIRSLHNEQMQEQKEIMTTVFENWKDDQLQIDDVCLLGWKC